MDYMDIPESVVPNKQFAPLETAYRNYEANPNIANTAAFLDEAGRVQRLAGTGGYSVESPYVKVNAAVEAEAAGRKAAVASPGGDGDPRGNGGPAAGFNESGDGIGPVDDGSRPIDDGIVDSEKGVGDNGKQGKTASKVTEIKYKPSSGVILKAKPGKTTTILGNFDRDMKNIISEMGNVKSTDFGPKEGGFNVLNVPDGMYKSPDQFWNNVNKPWLDEAIKRDDDIVLATKPERIVLSYIDRITGEEVITGFGREYNYLIERGYVYEAATNMMKKR